MIIEKWGCLEINWNTGILEQLERSSFLRGFSSAVMPLFSKALPGDVLLSEALSVMALPLAGPSHLLKASIAGYFRLIPLSSHVITRYLTLSHPSASYRTIGLAERLNFAA